jgi:HD-like signal output (HDOD) protein
MPLPDDLRALDVDLPACPRTLLDLLVLLEDEAAPLHRMADVIEGDMALAAAVVRTVNSAMFGLLRRVETVHEAVRHLGTREVAALTFAAALRAAFAPTPALEALWDGATRQGLLMGRSAAALGLDPWRAHTAGLFARSGQAVLLTRTGDGYADLLNRLGNDLPALLAAERQTCGMTHAALGSALCAAWGLAGDVVRFARHRGEPPAQWAALPAPLRDLLMLGAVVEQLLAGTPLEQAAAQMSSAQGAAGDTDRAALLTQAVRGPWLRDPQAPHDGGAPV